MLKEQASQLTFTHAQAFSQFFNAALFAIQGTFSDQSQCARNCIRSAAPRSQVRGGFWPATKTWTKSGILRGCCRAEERAILKLGCARRTDGTTVDTSRRNADEHQTVKAGVPAPQSTITSFTTGQFHYLILALTLQVN